jgi:hypothetical protein
MSVRRLRDYASEALAFNIIQKDDSQGIIQLANHDVVLPFLYFLNALQNGKTAVAAQMWQEHILHGNGQSWFELLSTGKYQRGEESSLSYIGLYGDETLITLWFQQGGKQIWEEYSQEMADNNEERLLDIKEEYKFLVHGRNLLIDDIVRYRNFEALKVFLSLVSELRVGDFYTEQVTLIYHQWLDGFIYLYNNYHIGLTFEGLDFYSNLDLLTFVIQQNNILMLMWFVNTFPEIETQFKHNYDYEFENISSVPIIRDYIKGIINK